MAKLITRQISTISLLLGLALAISATGNAATISVDLVVAEPGTAVIVPVRLANNTDLISSLIVPLQFDNLMLTADSVSFEGSIKPDTLDGLSTIDNAGGILIISYFPPWVDPIPEFAIPEGIIATIWFTLNQGQNGDTAAVDSVYEESYTIVSGDTIYHYTRVEIADNSNYFTPDFESGGVLVDDPTGILDDGGDGSLLPEAFELAQNYPNPFNPTTSIEFALPHNARVDLVVFNVLGQEVATIASGLMEAGIHTLEFDASGQPSGVYFYRLTYPSGTETRKMILLK